MRYRSLLLVGLVLVLGLATIEGVLAAEPEAFGGWGAGPGAWPPAVRTHGPSPGAGPGFFWGWGGGGGFPMSRQFAVRGHNLVLLLGLTSEQYDQVRQLQEAHSQAVAPLREELFKLSLDLRNLWKEPAANAEAIKEKSARVTEIQIELRQKAIDLRDQLKNILTPEQQQKLDRLQTLMRGRAGWHGFGPGNRQGPDGWGMREMRGLRIHRR